MVPNDLQDRIEAVDDHNELSRARESPCTHLTTREGGTVSWIGESTRACRSTWTRESIRIWATVNIRYLRRTEGLQQLKVYTKFRTLPKPRWPQKPENMSKLRYNLAAIHFWQCKADLIIFHNLLIQSTVNRKSDSIGFQVFTNCWNRNLPSSNHSVPEEYLVCN